MNDSDSLTRWRNTMLGQAEDALRLADGQRVDHLEAIIAGASLSLQDVCTAFGTRYAFLGALLKRTMTPMLEPLARCESAEAFRERLLAFGACAAERYASRFMRNLYRIALTECIRSAEIGRYLYMAGPGRLEEELAGFFEAARLSGFMRSQENSLYLAGALIALLGACLEDDVTGTYEAAPREAIAGIVSRFHDGIRGFPGDSLAAQ